MKILIVSEHFDPEPLARGLSFAKELQALGHSVEVLTGFPNYPGGKVYPGYKIRPFLREKIQGISVIRVALYPSHDKSRIKRILTYGSFSLIAALFGPFLVKRPDVIFVYGLPPFVAFPAMIIGSIYRSPFVYDIQDIWPDTLLATGMVGSKLVVNLAGAWCKLVYRFAKKITVISPGFKECLLNRNVPADKIRVIYNWCDDYQVGVAPRNEELAKSLGFEGFFNVIFAGNMGSAQSLDTLLDAAKIAEKRLPIVQFVFVGRGIEKSRLQARVENEGLKNVKFLDQMPLSEIKNIYALSDVLIIHLKDDPLFKITIPSKTQAYLASGRPILSAVGGNSDMLVLQAQAGLSCQPESSLSIVDTLEKFVSIPSKERELLGENGRKFYESELSLRVGVKKFEEIFNEISI